MVRRHIELAAVLIALASAGCLARTIPIPPPSASAAEADCDPTQCPGGGVIVTVTGMSNPMAYIWVEDTNRQYQNGTPYYAMAQATGATTSDGGASDGGDGGGGAVGAYMVTLEPQPDGAGGFVFAQHGDTLAVTQHVVQSDGSEDVSLPVMVTVP